MRSRSLCSVICAGSLAGIAGLGAAFPSSLQAQGTPTKQATASTPEARLKAAGITLPTPPTPIANYVPTVRTGNLVFVAGQGPMVDGKAVIAGKVGAEVTEQDGYRAARMAILNSLALLRAEIGSLDNVRRVVKLVGWVNSAPGFTRQPFVVNGASDLLVEIFGDAGRHARSSIGANELPSNIAVEIEIVVEVAPNTPRR